MVVVKLGLKLSRERLQLNEHHKSGSISKTLDSTQMSSRYLSWWSKHSWLHLFRT